MSFRCGKIQSRVPRSRDPELPGAGLPCEVSWARGRQCFFPSPGDCAQAGEDAPAPWAPDWRGRPGPLAVKREDSREPGGLGAAQGGRALSLDSGALSALAQQPEGPGLGCGAAGRQCEVGTPSPARADLLSPPLALPQASRVVDGTAPTQPVPLSRRGDAMERARGHCLIPTF